MNHRLHHVQPKLRRLRRSHTNQAHAQARPRATLEPSSYQLVSSTSLRYFVEVVRCGSIRAASENLYVAPSAISRQLALLEDSLGAPLLERRQGRGSVKLTAPGEILMRYYKNLSKESVRLHSEIEALQGLRRGHVNFGMPEGLTRDFMPSSSRILRAAIRAFRSASGWRAARRWASCCSRTIWTPASPSAISPSTAWRSCTRASCRSTCWCPRGIH